MKLLIMHDGKKVDEIEHNGNEVGALIDIVYWFHQHTNHSGTYAVIHGGYWIANEDGSPWLTREDFLVEGD